MLTRKQTDLLLYINPPPAGGRHFPLVRRDARCPRPQVQVRHSPADQRAGGARLYPPPGRIAPARWRLCACPNPPPLTTRRAPKAAVSHPGTNRPSAAPCPPPPNDLDLPLYGRIAAGTPIEALRDPDATVRVPAPAWSAAAAIMRWRSPATRWSTPASSTATPSSSRTAPQHQPGEIVVALVDREEVTLKYLHQQRRHAGPRGRQPPLRNPPTGAGSGSGARPPGWTDPRILKACRGGGAI